MKFNHYDFGHERNSRDKSYNNGYCMELSLFHISLVLYIQIYYNIPLHNANVPTMTVKQMSTTTVTQNAKVRIVTVGVLYLSFHSK